MSKCKHDVVKRVYETEGNGEAYFLWRCEYCGERFRRDKDGEHLHQTIRNRNDTIKEKNIAIADMHKKVKKIKTQNVKLKGEMRNVSQVSEEVGEARAKHEETMALSLKEHRELSVYKHKHEKRCKLYKKAYLLVEEHEQMQDCISCFISQKGDCGKSEEEKFFPCLLKV